MAGAHNDPNCRIGLILGIVNTTIYSYSISFFCQFALQHAHFCSPSLLKLAFHDANTDTDTDTDFLADILARIVARMSACRSACHRNNFRKSCVSDVSVRILARKSVSVSASWNSNFTNQRVVI